MSRIANTKSAIRNSKLVWSRPVRDVTSLFRRRTWRSRCGRYKLEEHVPLLASDRLVRWYVLRFEPCPLNNWWIVSKHRRRSAAFAAAERDARKVRAPQAIEGRS